jgi:hypothetical protein
VTGTVLDATGARAAEVPRRAWASPGMAASLIGALGLAYRLAMTALDTPRTNSDEATMGLMARHIVARGAMPTFFYGQHYMGAVEAYLAAPLVAIGVSGTMALRIPTLLLYGAFLAAMYGLTARLYSARFAVLVVALLALGSDRVLKDQLIAGGGYPEITALAAVLLWGALALTGIPDRATNRATNRWRTVGAALCGLGAGVAIWSDFLVVPYLLAAGVPVLARWRRLGGRGLATLGTGLVVGLAPLIVHDITNPAAHNSVAVALHMAGAPSGTQPTTLAARLSGGILLSIPLATGACQPGACGPVQLAWGAIYLALLVAALIMAAAGVRRTRAARGGDARARQLSRVALLGAAAFTIAAYVKSPAAAQSPIESARYLTPLLVATPAVLWPLWRGARRAIRAPRAAQPAARATAIAAAALLAAVTAVGAYATITAASEVPSARAAAADQGALIDTLDRLGVTGIYTDYWTCDRIAYATAERIPCVVVRDDLGAGLNRYPPYVGLVRATTRPAYVLPAGSAMDERFAALSGAAPDATVAGYHVYVSSPAASRTPA